jgi:hypothetical protein
MLRFFSRLVTIAFVLVAGLALSGRASAQTVPYLAKGGAQLSGAGLELDIVGSGQATYLGAYTEVGHVTLIPTLDPGVFLVTGGAVYTAANGDKLFAAFSGKLDATGAITAKVKYFGGCGRFEDASGFAILTGQMLGGGAASVTVQGYLEY